MSLPHRHAYLVILVLLVGCDQLTGVGPPAELQPDGLPAALTVSDTVDVSVTVLDDEGAPVSGETAVWEPGSGSVTETSTTTNAQGTTSTRWILGTVADTQTLSVTVASLEATFTADVGPGALATLILSPADTAMGALGDSVSVTAAAQDEYGNEVSPSSLTWTSSNQSIVTVALVRSTEAVVVAQAEGEATIEGTAGGVTGSATITVDQAVAALRVVPDSSAILITGRVDLDVEPVDARGAAVDTSVTVAWTSSDTTVVTVNDTGVVTGLDTGTVTITATAGSHTGQAVVYVRDGDRPLISSVSPSVLAAGDTATITGSGFPADTAEVSVTVGSVATRVLSAASTELRVELPPPSEFSCAPAGDMTVLVTANGLRDSVAHPVAGAPQYTLAAGESVALFDSDVACAELTEAGTYVVSVFNESTSPGAATSFTLAGTADGGTTADVALSHAQVDMTADDPVLQAPDPTLDGHFQLLDENIRVLQTMGTAGRPQLAGSQLASSQLAAQTLGEIRTFRIPDIEASNYCDNYIEVTAKAVYVGQYGVIWEDTLAPLAGQMDTIWDQVGTEYDQVMHPVLLDYFGDPLVFDDQLDANGQFFMLFSETVNNFQSPAVAAFVFAGDFYTRSQCASSDVAEIFYGRVPTADNGDDNPYEPGEVGAWTWNMRASVIHEVKHLTSYANKLDVSPTSPNWEESGTEEATARLAEEFYGRALQGYGQFDNVGYDASIWCERRVGPSYPSCDSVPVVMLKDYIAINTYLQQPSQLSPFGPVRSGDWTFYGTGWQWVRWAIDQSGVPEADFIKPLVREADLRGPANVADKAGRSVPELLADYTLAFAVDDHPSGTTFARSEVTMPSWDTRDIFQGLYDDFKNESNSPYPTPWPLEPHPVSGSFEVSVPSIYGGAASIFELSGTSGGQLLELLGYSGGTAPSVLGLSIVRVQ